MKLRRVLIADDDDVDRERVRRMLIGIVPPMEIIEAASADETLQQLSTGKVDCLLLDYQLGTTNATDLYTKLASTTSRHTPVIVITGNANERTAIEAVRQGVYDYLSKASLSRSQLGSAIEGSMQWARLRAQLRESEQRFEQLAESLPQLVWTCRPDGTCDYLSRQWSEYTGVPVDKLMAAGKAEYTHVDDRAVTAEAWRRAIDCGIEYRTEMRLRGADGRYRWFDARGVPIRNARGQIIKWVGSNSDIDENRTLSEALSRHAMMLDLAQDPIFAWTNEAGIEFWNRGCEQLYGYTSHEALGASSHGLLKTLFPIPLEQFSAELHRYGHWSGEVRHTTQDGRHVIVSSRHQMLRVGDHALVLESNRDITAQKKAEALQLQTQKMDSLGTLAGGVAHDFNNILLAISGHCSLAARAIDGGHPAQQYLGEISQASERAAQLVRRILLFARREEPKRERVKLEDIASEALKLMRASLPAMIDIRMSYGSGLGAISADSAQIHQVLVNLLTNSAHAIGNRVGHIEVSVSAVKGAQLKTEHPDLIEDEYICLAVCDDGCGIEPDILKCIFDPFFTTKSVGQGTGLGLSAVHGIVASHRALIDVKSKPGVGTTFTIFFPEAGSTAKNVLDAKQAYRRGNGEHILYVDDEIVIAKLMATILNRLNYRVTCFSDPEHALAAFQAGPLTYQAIVTDLSMPHMSGFALARAIRKISPDVPILLTSGYVNPEDELAAKELGITEILLKPDSIDRLSAALERALGGGDSTESSAR